MDFEEWLRQSLPALIRYANVLCGPSVAEEIVQDVAIKVHARWSKIKILDHPDAYVRKMITNEYLSWRRKWSRLIPHSELHDRPSGGGPGIGDRYAERAELIAELDRLPRKQRAVVVLRYVEGVKDPQIAEMLSCSEATVRSHASRALATLRVELTAASKTYATTEEGSHAH